MQHTRGFTLSELIVSLSILSVILTLAIPSFANLLTSNRATALVNDLVTSLHTARSEAIRQNRPVTMCKSSDRQHCTGSWDDGWIIFSDTDRDRHIDADQGDRILAVADAVDGSFALSWNAFRSDSHIQFSAMGFIHSNNGTFKICPPDNDPRQARAVIINRVGRARVSSDNNADGIDEDASGRPLVCP